MSQSIKVAVAGPHNGKINKHFGDADEFLIYENSAQGPVLLETRNVDASALENEERRDTICRILADCKTLLVAKIGEGPQKKLAGVGIDGTAKYVGKPVDEALALAFSE